MQWIEKNLGYLALSAIAVALGILKDPLQGLSLLMLIGAGYHMDLLHQKEAQQKKETAGKAAALDEAEKWYAQNERFLIDFPRPLFRTWQAQHLREDRPALEHWQAVEALVRAWDPIVSTQPRVPGRARQRINPDDV